MPIPPGVFGNNRTIVTPHYAVMPPAGILHSRLPGLVQTKVHFHTSPAMGARFAQALLVVARGGGTTTPWRDGLEHFFYVVEGEAELAAAGETRRLTTGGFVYVAAGAAWELRALSEEARLIWIKRPYVPAAGITPRASFFGTADATPRDDKNGHTKGRVWQTLLGEADLSMDMEINILSFQPGTHFPFFETHIMEHGLYMLRGQGLYMLGREIHEAWTGDFIWMGAYVPQQFYCTGWEEAAYLLYKDVNRDVVFDK